MKQRQHDGFILWSLLLVSFLLFRNHSNVTTIGSSQQQQPWILLRTIPMTHAWSTVVSFTVSIRTVPFRRIITHQCGPTNNVSPPPLPSPPLYLHNANYIHTHQLVMRRSHWGLQSSSSSSSSNDDDAGRTETVMVGVQPQQQLVELPMSDTVPSGTILPQQPLLSLEQMQHLQDQKYVIVPNFISTSLQEALRNDIQSLRQSNSNSNSSTNKYFRPAKIGQDATNTLNTDIRVAETCFIGADKQDFNVREQPNVARNELYTLLDTLRMSLMNRTHVPLDAQLSELLYAYYPRGGYYRTHLDAIPGSVSYLRQYSLLLYINDVAQTWDGSIDGGCLRLYTQPQDFGNTRNRRISDYPVASVSNGSDDDKNTTTTNYIDVPPIGGTLVLFQSDAIYHEVLDTTRERYVVVGWYNRPIQSLTDTIGISPLLTTDDNNGSSIVRIAMLAVAAGLVTIGVLNLV
jgi:SM-20-related protein